MPMIKYSPFGGELEDFPTGLRLFQDSLSRLFSEPASRPWSPAVDIYETENELVLKADLPDVDPKNVGIQLENGTLTLKGERKFEQEKNGKGFHRIERSYGSFVRAFSLPDTVEAEKVKADYKNGVLTVTVFPGGTSVFVAVPSFTLTDISRALSVGFSNVVTTFFRPAAIRAQKKPVPTSESGLRSRKPEAVEYPYGPKASLPCGQN